MKKYYLTYVIVLFFLTSCTTALVDREKKQDYFSEGFLNRHCFQVLVKGKSLKKNSGLIESRENAYYEAKSTIRLQAKRALKIYIKNHTCTPSKTGKTKSTMPPDALLNEIIGSGSIVQEYYRRDKSVVLVYRIIEKKLKTKIDTMVCKQ